MCCIQVGVLKFKSCIRILFYYDRPGIPADFDTTNILSFYFLIYVFFMLDTRVLYSLVIIPTGGEEKYTWGNSHRVVPYEVSVSDEVSGHHYAYMLYDTV